MGIEASQLKGSDDHGSILVAPSGSELRSQLLSMLGKWIEWASRLCEDLANRSDLPQQKYTVSGSMYRLAAVITIPCYALCCSWYYNAPAATSHSHTVLPVVIVAFAPSPISHYASFR